MMFKTQGSLSRIGGVIQGFLRFMRKLQTDVEHTRVTMDKSGAVKGNVVCLVAGDRVANLARANAASTKYEWVGIMSEPTDIDTQGVCQLNGRAEVLFESALAPACGTLCYVSASTAGSATNVAPIGAGEFVVPIGRIVGVAGYVTTGLCEVLLGQCCNSSNAN